MVLWYFWILLHLGLRLGSIFKVDNVILLPLSIIVLSCRAELKLFTIFMDKMIFFVILDKFFSLEALFVCIQILIELVK